MLFVIMIRSLIRLDSAVRTRSLIRLDSAVRTSLNTGLNDKVHDETRAKADVRTNVDDDGITKGYNE